MLRPLIELIFGCQHRNLTWPQSKRREGPLHRFHRKTTCTVTCLDCGAAMEYNWRQMKLGKRVFPAPHQHPQIAPTLGREEVQP